MPPQPGVSKLPNTLQASMIADDVARVVKSVWLVLELVKRQYMKHGHDVDQYENIRSKLRQSKPIAHSVSASTE